MIPVRAAHRPLTPIARERLARDQAEARQADRDDPHKVLLRRYRSELVGLSQVEGEADRRWHAENDPVRAPVGVGSGSVHPSRAKALAEFMQAQGWTSDPAEPVTATLTLAETLEIANADARARLAAAQTALEDYEAGVSAEPDETALLEPVQPVEEAPRRPRGRPPKMILDERADVVPEH